MLFGIVAIAAVSAMLLRKRNAALLGQTGREAAQARDAFAGVYRRVDARMGCAELEHAEVGGDPELAVIVRVGAHRRLFLVGERCTGVACERLVRHASRSSYRLPDLTAPAELTAHLDTLAGGGFSVAYAPSAGPQPGQDDFEATVQTTAGTRCVSLRRATRLRAEGEELLLERTLSATDPADGCAPLSDDTPCALRVVERFRRRLAPPDDR